MSHQGAPGNWTAEQCIFIGIQAAIETADEAQGYGATHPFQGSGSLEGGDDASLVLLLDDGSSYRLTAEQVSPPRKSHARKNCDLWEAERRREQTASQLRLAPPPEDG